jgi:hypothetical protein
MPAVPASGSELGAAVDVDRVSCDPAGFVRGQESDDRGDIHGLAYPLQRLHPKDCHATLLGLGKVRHVRVDHSGRDGVDADAARTEG